MKDWLGYELARNKEHSDLYVRLIKKAIGKMIGGGRVEVLIGHHITFETSFENGDLDISTENEIPSADCVMFDHSIMTAVFGGRAIPLMRELVSVPCEEREVILRRALDAVEGGA